MAARTIDGPGRPERSFVTDAEAAEWLGVSEDTFLRWVGIKKGTPLPGVPEWMRPNNHGQKRQWDVLDVIALRQMVVKRQHQPHDEIDEKS